MKTTESENFKYTQKKIIIGDKVRNIMIIDKKPSVVLGQGKVVNTFYKTVSTKKKRCSGCSRNKRG